MLQPAMGSLIIGLLLVAVPQIMGVGYEYVDQALNGGLLLRTMVLLCVVKLAATIVSYSSGNAGGIFAPSLYIGAMTGGALGMLVHRLAPFPTADPGAYALVGMGTLFAGIVRAPMTSVFMIFEITQDYQILVPLMVANLLSFMISRRYQPVPVYHALLQQDQVHLPGITSRAPRASWTAREVMSPAPPQVAADQSVDSVAATLNHASGLLIDDGGRFVGVVTGARLAQALEAGHGAVPVGSLLDGHNVHAHPDHGSDAVLERLGEADGVLPVVSREDAQHVVGVVTVADVMRFMRRRAKAPAGKDSVAQAESRSAENL
jgi:CIC family chloride channel protein